MRSPLPPDAWVAVRRAALLHNAHEVQTLLAQDAAHSPTVIAVVKADGYGHGMIEAARTFEAAGIGFFAVTTSAEGIALRGAGITGRVLVFLPPLPDQAEILIDADIDMTVTEETTLAAITDAAKRLGKAARVHLKIDTGMGRLGVLPADALPLAQRLAVQDSVRFAGIYTHFARALENDPGPTRRQFQQFQQTLQTLSDAGIDPGLRHCCNSAAMLRFPEMRLDAVRPGTVLYGQYPSAAVPRLLDLQDSWRLHARVVSVRDVPAGSSIGYGGEFVIRRPSRLAVLPIGYADGFTVAPASAQAGWRGLKSWLRRAPLTVTLHDQRVPVVGRVAMQTCIVDVTDLPSVSVGDIATLPARRITTSACLPRIYED